MRIVISSLRPPRHPLLRLLLGLAGVALLALFSAVAFVIAALVLTGFGVRQLWRALSNKPTAPHSAARSAANASGVIEGEYRVVQRDRTPLSSH